MLFLDIYHNCFAHVAHSLPSIFMQVKMQPKSRLIIQPAFYSYLNDTYRAAGAAGGGGGGA